MKRLIRMAYGRSGSRLDQVLVSASQAEPAAGPRWLTLLSVALLIVVQLVVFRFGTPPPVAQRTVVDMSRLTVKQVNLPESPIVMKEQSPVEQCPLPTAKPDTAVARAAEKPSERAAVALPPEEMCRPVIARPSAQPVPAAQDYQPRIARERIRIAGDSPSPRQPRVRRDSPVLASLSESAPIFRARQAATTDLSGSAKGTVPLRRSPSLSEVQPSASEVRVVRRSLALSGDAEAHASRVTAVRERSAVAEEDSGGKRASVGLSRGVSLAALGVCSNSQHEDDAIRAVLGIVGARRSCRSEKGEYQFTGTKRISSFNLMIFPAEGRIPSNRCEELENAYICLQTR